MKKQIQVTMPDGSVWGVPAEIVAEHRADYYANRDGESVRMEEFVFTMNDSFTLTDWAEGNMNWRDVEKFAVKIKDAAPVDYQNGWVNGQKKVVTL